MSHQLNVENGLYLEIPIWHQNRLRPAWLPLSDFVKAIELFLFLVRDIVFTPNLTHFLFKILVMEKETHTKTTSQGDESQNVSSPYYLHPGESLGIVDAIAFDVLMMIMMI